MSRLVDLTLETADCRLDRFSLSNVYLDGDSELGARCYESKKSLLDDDLMKVKCVADNNF